MRKGFFVAVGPLVVAATLMATSATVGAAAPKARTAPTGVQKSKWDTTAFECTAPATVTNTATLQSCKTSAPNARCVERSSSPTVTQVCIITQTGTYNNAYVNQEIDSNSAPTTANTQTQDGKQSADVSQGGFSNSVDVRQEVEQALKGSSLVALTQKQDSSQIVTVCQGGTDCSTPNAGTNESDIRQERLGLARAYGTGIVQLQDRAFGTDCTPTFPYTPNICASVEQNSTTRNDSDLGQQHHLSLQGPVNADQEQLQSSGGLDGHVVQPTVGNAQNTNTAHQHLTVEANGAVLQKQDPGMGCCSWQSERSHRSGANIHQVGVLRATSPSADQQLEIEGDCISTGSCSVVSHGRINNASRTERCSAQAGEGPAICMTTVFCQTGGGCLNVVPDSFAMLAMGFDTMDVQNAINYVFPATLLGI